MRITENKLRKMIREVISESFSHPADEVTQMFGDLTACFNKDTHVLTFKLGDEVLGTSTSEEYVSGFADLPEGFEVEAEEAIDWARDEYSEATYDSDYSDLDDPGLNPYR
jgi:hypothetical protein